VSKTEAKIEKMKIILSVLENRLARQARDRNPEKREILKRRKEKGKRDCLGHVKKFLVQC
jgi:hypothetical protein